MDSLVIDYSHGLNPKDFISKEELVSRRRKGRRLYLNDSLTRQMMGEPERYFESKVEITLMRHGQRLETLINEETLPLAKYLRGGKTRARILNPGHYCIVSYSGQWIDNENEKMVLKDSLGTTRCIDNLY